MVGWVGGWKFTTRVRMKFLHTHASGIPEIHALEIVFSLMFLHSSKPSCRNINQKTVSASVNYPGIHSLLVQKSFNWILSIGLGYWYDVTHEIHRCTRCGLKGDQSTVYWLFNAKNRLINCIVVNRPTVSITDRSIQFEMEQGQSHFEELTNTI